MLINTRNLIIGIPDDKQGSLEYTLHNTWHPRCKSFALREVTSLLRLVSNLALATSWAKCTHIALQRATFLAIKFNSHTVFSSGKFHCLTEILRSTNITTRKFYLDKAHKTVWDGRKPFFITSMRAEIALIGTITTSPTTSRWETPIRHAMPTACDHTVPGDTYLTGAGAYYTVLCFWYCAKWPVSVEQRTLSHVDKKQQLYL